MIGPFINGFCIIAGSLIGAALGPRFPERLRTTLPLAFGVSSLGIGVSLLIKLAVMPPVILAFLLGTGCGELLRFEDSLGALAHRARSLVSHFGPSASSQESHAAFEERYVALLVLFCASGFGIFASINEGLGNGPMLLVTKAILDFFTAMIFAVTLGPSLAFIALPQTAIQVSLVLCAGVLSRIMTPSLMGNFSACGGLIMLATGLRICGIKHFPIANMLPGLIFVVPLSAFWIAVF